MYSSHLDKVLHFHLSKKKVMLSNVKLETCYSELFPYTSNHRLVWSQFKRAYSTLLVTASLQNKCELT